MDFMTFFHANALLVGGFVVVLLLFIGNEFKSFSARKVHISALKAIKMVNDDEAFFVDIRKADSFKEGHILNAINIPEEELDAKLETSERFHHKTAILYCDSGDKSTKKTLSLLKTHKDITILSMQGGFYAWQQANLPIKVSKK